MFFLYFFKCVVETRNNIYIKFKQHSFSVYMKNMIIIRFYFDQYLKKIEDSFFKSQSFIFCYDFCCSKEFIAVFHKNIFFQKLPIYFSQKNINAHIRFYTTRIMIILKVFFIVYNWYANNEWAINKVLNWSFLDGIVLLIFCLVLCNFFVYSQM